MMGKVKKTPLFYTFVLYICGLFLFLEWIYPAKNIAEINHFNVFIFYTLFCFLISMLQVKWWASFPLKGFGLLFIINRLFFHEPFLSKRWINELFVELSFNVQSLFTQNWYNITDLFRTILFFLVIWLMSYLIHYWFIEVKRIFLFVLLTFIYISVLDTFTAYNANTAVIRVFIISFIAFGMASFFKEVAKESIHFPWLRKSYLVVFPLISIVFLSAFIGYITPVFEPQWPDPVPFITGASKNAQDKSNTTIKKVGYGEDDSHLGGSFIQDFTPVFKVATEEKQYWRIETKDVYTGKGWDNSTEENQALQKNGNIHLQTFFDGVETEEQMAFIEFGGDIDLNKTVYPYGVSEIKTNDMVQYYLDVNTEVIHAKRDDKQVHVPVYKMTFDKPTFDITAMREITEQDPSHIRERYTQLPSDLPERVHELAEEITNAYDNRYDKAKAMEQYFGQAGFVYQIANVAVPDEDQDYVDQFLFDTEAGYCDNYSTSMAVMLRTLDIPSRWVKGFTGGEKISDTPSLPSENVYEITNANAHSWVEVYFPEVGWVPFEPTQGFNNLSEFEQPITRPGEEEETDVPEESEEEEIDVPEMDEDDNEKQAEQEAKAEQTTNSKPLNKWYIVGLLVFISLLLFVLYKTRLRWKTVILSRKLQKEKQLSAKTYEEAYHHLLALLSYHGLPKQLDVTLREYAAHVDRRYRTKNMSLLTNYYEQMVYNNQLEQIENNDEIVKLWRHLIKQITASK